MPRITLIFDRLNVLKQSLEEREELKKDEVIDEVLDLLILAYICGNEDASESVGLDIGIDQELMFMAINRKYDDKDYADRISEYVAEQDIEKIMRVAETDSHRVYNEGAYETAIQSGRNLKKTWLTMNDEKVRDTHYYLEGVTVGIEDRFYTYDGDSARYPGDFFLAENNCNCRCICLYE